MSASHLAYGGRAGAWVGDRMSGDWFVYALIALNAGACVAYTASGSYTKAFYWLCVIGLNLSLLRLK